MNVAMRAHPLNAEPSRAIAFRAVATRAHLSHAVATRSRAFRTKPNLMSLIHDRHQPRRRK